MGIFFFQGITSRSFWITKATAASLYLPFNIIGPESSPKLDGLPPLGVPATEPETRLWLTPLSAFFCASGLTNLKAKLVLNPKSILCLSECQRHPDFDEFFVDVILNTFVCWSNLMSPS